VIKDMTSLFLTSLTELQVMITTLSLIFQTMFRFQ